MRSTGTNDRNAPRTRFSAGLDIAPALNPMGSPVAVNRASGVTRAIVAPGGSSNLFAGQGAVVDLADDMDMVTKPRALQFVAFGEAGSAKAGGSRAATFLLFREQLLAARSYARNPATLAEWGNDAMIQRADADALVQVINGTTPLFVRVDRAADIVNVLKLRQEFPALKLVLVGVTEGWLVARETGGGEGAGAGVAVDRPARRVSSSSRRDAIERRTAESCRGRCVGRGVRRR